MIIISFDSQALHDLCVNLEHAEQLLGSTNAEALVTFISDAQALENVEELIELLGPDAQICPDDSLSVAIGSDYRAALVVAGKRFDLNTDQRIDWASVTRLKLMEISRLP